MLPSRWSILTRLQRLERLCQSPDSFHRSSDLCAPSLGIEDRWLHRSPLSHWERHPRAQAELLAVYSARTCRLERDQIFASRLCSSEFLSYERRMRGHLGVKPKGLAEFLDDLGRSSAWAKRSREKRGWRAADLSTAASIGFRSAVWHSSRTRRGGACRART
jgi:hypothetical protein